MFSLLKKVENVFCNIHLNKKCYIFINNIHGLLHFLLFFFFFMTEICSSVLFFNSSKELSKTKKLLKELKKKNRNIFLNSFFAVIQKKCDLQGLSSRLLTVTKLLQIDKQVKSHCCLTHDWVCRHLFSVCS